VLCLTGRGGGGFDFTKGVGAVSGWGRCKRQVCVVGILIFGHKPHIHEWKGASVLAGGVWCVIGEGVRPCPSPRRQELEGAGSDVPTPTTRCTCPSMQSLPLCGHSLPSHPPPHFVALPSQELSVPGGPLQHAGHTAVEGDVDGPGGTAAPKPPPLASPMGALAEGEEAEEREEVEEGADHNGLVPAGGAGAGEGVGGGTDLNGGASAASPGPIKSLVDEQEEVEAAAAAAALAAMVTPAPPPAPKRPTDGK
jgi:hypothetical protein